MRILIIMGGFFPGKKFGGPPVSVDNFCKLMSDEECFIYTYNHEMGETKPYDSVQSDVWIQRDHYTIKYVNQTDYCKNGFEKAIIEIKPDIIYLQGLFQSCILPCLSLAKKYKINVLLAPRGELCSGAFKKKYKKVPYILYLKLMKLINGICFQSTSEEETEAIKAYLGIGQNRIFSLSNIPSIPAKVYEKPEKKAGEARFVFLSRVHPKKNLLSAIKYFDDIEGNVKFDIYGPLEDEVYWQECRAEIDKLPSNIKVEYCGLVSHDQVHEVFSRYDAFVFPTYSENYGHVIAEALIVGTPVIISNTTPWNDVTDAGAGWALPLENVEGFKRAIKRILDADNNEYSIKAKEYAIKKMNLAQLKKEYKTTIESVIEIRD